MDQDWSGGWDEVRSAQVAAWRGLTAAQRLAWLEEALVFAAASGALARDRARRAREAARWTVGHDEPDGSGTLASRADGPPGPRRETFPG